MIATRNPISAKPETYRDMLIALADEVDCFAAHAEPGAEVMIAFTPQELKAISSSLRADIQRVPATPAAETFATISAWAEATFGPITPERTVARADEEMVELRAEPDSVEEAADVVICLARYAGLWAAVERKMAVNRTRQWRRVGDGTGYHIKPGATQDPAPLPPVQSEAELQAFVEGTAEQTREFMAECNALETEVAAKPFFRAGDHVLHSPSGETWVVAWADPVTGDLGWCGWPDGVARISDCTLVKAASDAEHQQKLRELKASGGSRAAKAVRLYGEPAEA
ncbi:dATP/dGTP pyrophosphohydrolase domain-containing protein [Methylobacterium sp. CCH5-D2]|uniref:dATP/dGTP pyrophosphohydrolase domain-containing protein n=1 Tax=Methylobacterium sp. CCH5-D2 TaxID=1768765 RepID=UPI00082A785C|nr:dATP/dGTP pyrophosphohydrolase domain-containing protein [Methylobacterium sp. CCH5-D2]